MGVFVGLAIVAGVFGLLGLCIRYNGLAYRIWNQYKKPIGIIILLLSVLIIWLSATDIIWSSASDTSPATNTVALQNKSDASSDASISIEHIRPGDEFFTEAVSATQKPADFELPPRIDPEHEMSPYKPDHGRQKPPAGGGEKYYLSVMLITKDDGDILEEWLEHYLWQGAEHFYIMDNGTTDQQHLDLYKKYAQYITLHQDSRKHIQVPSGIWLSAKYGHETEWMLIVDSDEYVFPSKVSNHYTLTSLIQHVQFIENPCAFSIIPKQLSVISIMWTMIGSSGRIKQPESIRMGFGACTPINRCGKTNMKVLYRPSIAYPADVNPHTADPGWNGFRVDAGLACNDRKDSYDSIGDNPHGGVSQEVYDTHLFRLYHYPIMSWQRFEERKTKRGDAETPVSDNVRDVNYFENYDRGSTYPNHFAVCSELADLLKRFEANK